MHARHQPYLSSGLHQLLYLFFILKIVIHKRLETSLSFLPDPHVWDGRWLELFLCEQLILVEDRRKFKIMLEQLEVTSEIL